jgi:hypothetical protein
MKLKTSILFQKNRALKNKSIMYTPKYHPENLDSIGAL